MYIIHVANKALFENEETPLPESLSETAVVEMLEEAKPKQDKKKIKVIASMFGRETPVELDSASVQAIV